MLFILLFWRMYCCEKNYF